MPALPPEIWRSIFREATHVPMLLDTEWTYEPDEYLWDDWESIPRPEIAAAAVTKQNICSVCQTWRILGVEFLYESVRVPPEKYRMEILLQTINASTCGSYRDRTNGWWTKRIEYLSDATISSLDVFQSILKSCPNLQIFIVAGEGDTQQENHSLLSKRCHSNLRRTELRHHPRYQDYYFDHQDALPNAPLTTLAISIQALMPCLPLHPSFDTVSTLTLDLCDLDGMLIPKYWLFPNLRSLALTRCRSITRQTIDELSSFVERHSSTLTYLHTEDLDVSTILPRVGNLRTLTLTLATFDATVSAMYRLRPLGSNVEPPSHWPGITHIGVLMPGDVLGGYKSGSLPNNVGYVMKLGMFPDLKAVCLLRHTGKGNEWVKFEQMMGRYGVRVRGVARVSSSAEQLEAEAH